MPDAATPDKRVPSDGESSEDELSRDWPSDAPKETIISSAPSAPFPPPSSGTRRRHRHRRRRLRPAYFVAALCAIVVAGLLLATQGSWPFASSPSEGSHSVAPLSVVTPSGSYPGSATSSLPVAVGSPTASSTVNPSATSSPPVAVGSPTASSTVNPSATSSPPVAVASPTVRAPSHATVANRIVISRLQIDMRIVEGDGLDAPLGKVAHYPGTAWPGGGSNIYLYAHARDGMFLDLWYASIGDEVVLTLVDGSERRYVVSQIRPNVKWDDMSVLSPTSTEELTLQTCTSYQNNAPRFVVIAVPEQ